MSVDPNIPFLYPRYYIPAMAAGSKDSDDDIMFPSFSSAPKPVAMIQAKRHSKEKESRSSHNKKRRTSDKHRHTSQSAVTKYKPSDKKSRPSALRRLLEGGDLVMDRHGDRNLLLYQSSGKSGTPLFRRHGGRRVLGLGGQLRVEETSSDGRFIQLVRPTTRTQRYVDMAWTGSASKTEYVASTEQPPKETVTCSEYIALSESLSGDEVEELQYDSDHGGVDFRSLDGMAKHMPSTPKVPRQSQPDPAQTRLWKNIAGIEARLSQNKHDVDAWIAYSALQEQVAALSFSRRTHRNTAIAKLQIEILRRAISLNPGSKKLWTEYLKRCQDVFDTAEMLEEWNRALSETQDPDMVLTFVDFCQGLSDRFTVSWMMDRFDEACQLLTRILCDNRRIPGVVRRTSVLIVHIVHRACLLLRESGYTEQAISLYQAVVEWIVFCPETLRGASFGHRKHAFEGFWNSGVPRIGSPGASGWCSFDKMNLCSIDNIHVETNAMRAASESEWLELEIESSQRCSGPLTIPTCSIPSEPTESFDPFAIAVFEDVEPFLVDVPWDKCVAAVLLDNLLRFLGMVSPDTCVFSDRQIGQPQGASRDFGWSIMSEVDANIASTVSRIASEKATTNSADSAGGGRGESGEWIDGIFVARQTKSALASIQDTDQPHFAYVSMPITLDMVETPLPYRFSCPWLEPASAQLRDVTRRLLEQLSIATNLDTRQRLMVRVALIEWSGAHWPDCIDELSCQIREMQPACLPLLNSLAKTYAHRGCWEQARTIWSQALGGIGEKSSAEDKAWAAVVRKSWAVSELLHGQGIDKFQQIVQEQAEFGSNPANSISGTIETRCAAYEMQIWSAYLRGRSTHSADAAAHACAADGLLETEQLGLVLASVHFYHMQNCRVAPPRALRAHLQAQLVKFPYLTPYWEMLLASEPHSTAGFHILRQLESTPPASLLSVYVMATMNVSWESRLAQMQCRSALIWAVCLAAAARGNRVRASRMKRMAHMAVRMCPWAKPLYLSAIGAGYMTKQERSQLLTALVARELRTCVFVDSQA